MKKLLVVVSFCIYGLSFGQDSTEVDASKPTNFYTQINNQFEFNSRNFGGNIMGYRPEFILAPSEAHLILAETPILYNSNSKKGGISDLRARYFFLPYKNYDKFFGAFGPSIDVFAPTGNFNHGIGSGKWLIQPGVTAGLMIADWIQMFPILSYQYSSKNVWIDSHSNNENHGISFQIITPIVFSEKAFIQITPIYSASDFTNQRIDRYIQELYGQYAIKEKLQISAFYRGIFKDIDHTFRMGLVLFL